MSGRARPLTGLGAVLVAGLALAAAPGAPTAPATVPPPAVLAVRSTSDDRVTLVADARAVPPQAPSASVTAGGATLPAQVTPLWSDATAVGLVVDAAATDPDVRGAGLAGAAGFLLQLPQGARSGVVVDRRPPVLATPPGTDPAGTLAALSGLPGGGTRDTSAALTLALERVPERAGDRAVVVLYTSGGDAGGEPAAALGERFRAAGAVLAVVTTNQDPSYWRSAAAATGGLVVATDAAGAIAAFDQVADALRTRFVVGFQRPPSDGAAGLRWTAGGAPVVVPVAIPPERPADTATAWPWASAPVAAGIGVAALVALAGGLLLVTRRRRRTADELVPAVPSGVRVFDVDTEAPREITDSLFEPRSVRDARERAARDRAERLRAGERRDGSAR
jgi:hypothetical protein